MAAASTSPRRATAHSSRRPTCSISLGAGHRPRHVTPRKRRSDRAGALFRVAAIPRRHTPGAAASRAREHVGVYAAKPRSSPSIGRDLRQSHA